MHRHPSCPTHRAIRILLVGLVWIGLYASPARPQTADDERMMRQWREATQYEEAIARCRETLARPDLDHEARGWWTRWQIDLETQSILAGDDFLEPTAWAAIDSLRDQFPRRSPPNLADIRVDLQHGISQRARAEAILATGDPLHRSSDQQRQAEQLLDTAARRLAGLAKQIPRSPAGARPGTKRAASPDDPPRPGKEAARQSQLLRYQLTYEEAATRLALAAMHSGASEARQRQAREAQLRIGTLTRITSDPALADSSRLLEVACLRLLGKDREADEQLRRLAERAASQADNRLSLRVLTAELDQHGTAMSSPKPGSWLRLRDAVRDTRELDPDLDVAARLALIRSAARLLAKTDAVQFDKNSDAPQRLQEERDAWRAEIEHQREYLSTHYPRWRSLQAERILREASPRQELSPAPAFSASRATVPPKADEQLAKPPASTPTSPKPTVATAAERTLLNSLIQTVNERKAQGNLAAALAPCEQAAALARKIGENDLCFQLTFQAAAIFHQQQDHEQSLRRFRELALEFPRHARAAEAHALAIRHAAVAPQQAQSIIAWDALLREHLQNWPDGPTANRCRLQLGRYLDQQGDLDEAISIWMQAQGESDAWPEQWALLRSAFLRKLQTVEPSSPSRERFLQSVAEYWSRWDANADSKSPNAERVAAIVYGSEWSLLSAPSLTQTPADLRAVKQRLDTVAHDKGCPANLQALRQALVGYAAARDGDFAATRATWQGLDWNSLEVTLPLLEQLDQFASDALAQKSTVEAPESTMENWNLLETEILAQLQRIPSWADNPRTWQLTARIHQRRGERAEALRIYNRLLEKLPRDLALRREMATLLDTATTDAERQASIQNWQAFVQASDEGSVDWYDGHFGLIQAMLRAGQRDDAEKKFAELRAAHPELGGAPSAARLRQLLEEGR